MKPVNHLLHPSTTTARGGRFAVGVRLTLALFLTIGGLIPLIAGSARAQDGGAGFATTTMAPADSIAYVGINLDLESDQWQQTQTLLERIGFPDTIDQMKQSIVSDMTEVDDPEAALDAILGGEIGIAVDDQVIAFALRKAKEEGTTEIPFDVSIDDNGGIGVAAIFLPGDPDAAWALIEDQMNSEADDSGEPITESEYNGVTIFSGPKPEGDDDVGGAIARVDDAIIFAGLAQDLEPIIDTANGDSDALADLDEMNELSAGLADESLMFAFINGVAIVDTLGPDFVAAMEKLAPQMQSMGALGGYFGSVVWADDPGFRMDTLAMMADGGSFADMMPGNSDLTFDERVPGETLFFVDGVAQPGMWSGVALSVAQAINGSMGGGMSEPADITKMMSEEYIEEQFAAAEQVLGFDLRADFFDLLSGEYGLAFSFPNMMTGGFDVDAVFATGVEDAGTLGESLAKLARMAESMGGGIDVSTRKVDGDIVYIIQDPNATDVPKFEFGVVSDELILSAGNGLDNAVNGPATMLADNELYQEVLGTLPDEYAQVVYFDISQLVPFMMMMSGASGTGIVDADPACAEFSTQAAAQETYDADPFANSTLDLDFDGEACEDHFNPPDTTTPTGSLEALKAFAAVTYLDGDMYGQSAILYISEA